MNLTRYLKPTLTSADIRFTNWMAPVVLVVFCVSAILAIQRGHIGECVQHIGFFILIFSAMIGPSMWGLVDRARDRTLATLLTIAQVLGILLAISGALSRWVQ